MVCCYQVTKTVSSRCVGCDIVQADHAPEAGVAQGSSMEFSSGTMAGFRKRWKKDLRTK